MVEVAAFVGLLRQLRPHVRQTLETTSSMGARAVTDKSTLNRVVRRSNARLAHMRLSERQRRTATMTCRPILIETRRQPAEGSAIARLGRPTPRSGNGPTLITGLVLSRLACDNRHERNRSVRWRTSLGT
jgi:hypothetical protein